MRSSRVITSVAAAALLCTGAFASMKHPDPLPGHHGFLGPHTGQYIAPAQSPSGSWQALLHAFPGSGFPDTAVQMTDGTVLMHDGCTINWFRLTPDNMGNYHNGTWSAVPSMPAGYSPLYFASQVLADGRLIVNGGEYLNCSAVWTNKGALYDPFSNTWVNVPPPAGWSNIGDAQSVVLSDGTYMLADCCNTKEAKATSIPTSGVVVWTATGTAKADSNNEEGWTTLPSQQVLTVDANINLGGPNSSEIYTDANPSGSWASAGSVGTTVVDSGSHELGPAPLVPNGLVFQIGATAHTSTYDSLAATWTPGPDMPIINGQLDSADGPAAVLPCGRILTQVSPGVFNAPSHFLEITVNSPASVSMAQVSEPASAASQTSYEGRLLVLPTGQILWSSDVGDVQIYSPKHCKVVKAAVPKIKKVQLSLAHGSVNNKITGFGFNGLTEGGYYGDDAQMATNYPLVRIVNNSSSHVCYARTHNHATMGISDGTLTSTQFDIPASCDLGASQLYVVVNGIQSQPKAVTIT